MVDIKTCKTVNHTCAWDGNLNGVHAPKNWKSLNQGSWTRAIFELIKCCQLNYITLDEAEDYIEYRTVENLTDINLEVDYTEEFNQMNLQTGNIIEIVLICTVYYIPNIIMQMTQFKYITYLDDIVHLHNLL